MEDERLNSLREPTWEVKSLPKQPPQPPQPLHRAFSQVARARVIFRNL